MSKNLMKYKAILAFALVVLLLAGCKEDVQQTAARHQQGPVEVDTIILKTEPVKMEVELPGRMEPFRVAEVRPQVNGIIQERLFTEGSEVNAGDVLYQIDPSIYQAQYDSAKAALAKAEAVEHSTKVKADKYRNLVRSKAVSELDQIEVEATWQQAVADIASAKAALNSAKINLDYTKITAPISGRIGKSMITEGALVTAQQTTALAIIQQLDPLYVDVTQSSTELQKLKKNFSVPAAIDDNHSRVSILLEDGSEYGQTGTLEFSDVTVDETTGTVTLRAIIANPDEELLPGMFVRARISNSVNPDAVLVPAASISRNNKGQAMVMLVNSESKVESRIIESGRNIGDKVLVNGGLKGTEVLITAGLQKIKPGVTVKSVSHQQTAAPLVSMNVQPASSAAHKE